MSSITSLSSTMISSSNLKTSLEKQGPVSANQNSSGAPIASNSHQSGWYRLIPDVEADPKYAKTMAEAVTFIPDKLLVDLNDLPPLSDVKAMQAFTNKSTEFDKVAEKLTEQRIEIFNDMKSQKSTDFEIFKAILAFNDSQPMDYQIKSGYMKLDLYA